MNCPANLFHPNGWSCFNSFLISSISFQWELWHNFQKKSKNQQRITTKRTCIRQNNRTGIFQYNFCWSRSCISGVLITYISMHIQEHINYNVSHAIFWSHLNRCDCWSLNESHTCVSFSKVAHYKKSTQRTAQNKRLTRGKMWYSH